MSVSTFTQPDFTTAADGTTYKTNLDDAVKVLSNGLGDLFAVHAQSSPNMTVRVDAGRVLTGSYAGANLAVATIAAQSSGAITAPSVNPRIDLVYVTKAGVVGVITGAEAASPAVPALTAGKIPLATIALTTSTTSIANSIITDIRLPFWIGGLNAADTLEMNGGGIT